MNRPNWISPPPMPDYVRAEVAAVLADLADSTPSPIWRGRVGVERVSEDDE